MKQLCVIGTVIPEPRSTAAGTRMLQLLSLLKEAGYGITFLSAAQASENSADLSSLGMDYLPVQINDEDFAGKVQHLTPDCILFDRFTTEEQFGWKVRELWPDALTILDTEDLHFLRKAREKAFKERRNLTPDDLISDTFKREMAAMLRCDLSLIISEYEMQLLTGNFRMDPELLHYLPMFGEDRISPKGFSERKDFVSIGNFLHEPNWQTVLQLKQLWPELRKRIPGAELHIYGAYVKEKARQLHNPKEGFLIKGHAEQSVESLFENYRVLLAPIPFGAGIKGKLLDSMQYGLPNVTTEVGAEAMQGNLPWNGFITDTEHFAEKAAELYSNEELWTEAQENGRTLVRERFASEHFETGFMERIEFLQKNLPTHRTRNFFGQILQYHSLQSTKYLGKWIEEKNRRS